MKNLAITFALTLFAALAAPLGAQQESAPGFDAAAAGVEQRLQQAVAELDALRDAIAAEQLPLSRQLRELEAELAEARTSFQAATRLLDGRALDLSTLNTDLKARRDEALYLSNLLGEYVRNFESRLHIAELRRHEGAVATARLAAENSALSEGEVMERQAALLDVAFDRLEEGLGGARFPGQALDVGGLLTDGTYVMVGPIAVFLPAQGEGAGLAEQRLGSLEPTVIPFGRPEDAAAAAALVRDGEGRLPLDATLGNAHKIEATQESLWEHIRKGGTVMVPIFVLAGLALAVALYKWATLSVVKRAPPERIEALLAAVARRDRVAATREAGAIGGPSGQMLVAGVEHLDEPRELVEEVMYERLLATRLRLQRMLPFVAISASAAPLLGLLGTVTGIMNTFKLITVFGTGDVKTLSGGISEALITTEYGLIVAIPSLLLHAFLSRKARGIVDQMEQAAIAFVNQLSKAPVTSAPKAA